MFFIVFTADSRMYRTAIGGIKKLKPNGKGFRDSDGNNFNINQTQLVHLVALDAWNSSDRNNSIRVKLFNDVSKKLLGVDAERWKKMNSVQRVNYWNQNIRNKKFELWIEITIKWWNNGVRMKFLVEQLKG